MRPELGVVEGFYGPMWSDADRSAFLAALGHQDFGFYHYAPKADPAVRQQWTSCWSDHRATALQELGRQCRRQGLRFGLAVSPVGAQRCFNDRARRALSERVAQMVDIGIDDLVMLFDDERSDTPALAARQAEVAEFAAARASNARVFFCPTWYSDDPLLDAMFGQRPPDYLAELGRTLDAAVAVYWAGPQICPAEIPVTHIQRVAETLGRAPVLWDNYPVNDSPRMIRHLHLRAFSGRPAGLAEVSAGHAINPALQPFLSTIPTATLPMVYQLGADYEPEAAFLAAARACLGNELATCLHQDLGQLQDQGLDGLDREARTRLRCRYADFDHPAALEVVRFLDGDYPATAELAPT